MKLIIVYRKFSLIYDHILEATISRGL